MPKGKTMCLCTYTLNLNDKIEYNTYNNQVGGGVSYFE